MSTPVFRQYDQAALDREYDNRRKVAAFPEWLARYTRESERVRKDLDARLDVAYGPTPAERLDIFPAGTRAPINVFVHGGYWRSLDKAEFDFVAGAFVPAGVASVVVNYALVPSVSMDELVRQCRAAVTWVHRNAASFGGDPDRIFVSGHSAGGHLVAMLLATDWRAFDGLPADVVKGGAGISGLYDLEPIRLCYLNDTLGLTPEDARRNSPVLLPAPRRGALLLTLGGEEGPEYHRQTDDLARAWRHPDLAIDVLDLAGEDHFSIVAQLEAPASALSRAILAQMGVPGR
ncbi:MAG: alpha/beta hydrolase [Candidatus Rokubacteria bacterium]|nr:alpha/beta hydrolase [Candidatus Rokubacteria bacterium]